MGSRTRQQSESNPQAEREQTTPGRPPRGRGPRAKPTEAQGEAPRGPPPPRGLWWNSARWCCARPRLFSDAAIVWTWEPTQTPTPPGPARCGRGSRPARGGRPGACRGSVSQDRREDATTWTDGEPSVRNNRPRLPRAASRGPRVHREVGAVRVGCVAAGGGLWCGAGRAEGGGAERAPPPPRPAPPGPPAPRRPTPPLPSPLCGVAPLPPLSSPAGESRGGEGEAPPRRGGGEADGESG